MDDKEVLGRINELAREEHGAVRARVTREGDRRRPRATAPARGHPGPVLGSAAAETGAAGGGSQPGRRAGTRRERQSRATRPERRGGLVMLESLARADRAGRRGDTFALREPSNAHDRRDVRSMPWDWRGQAPRRVDRTEAARRTTAGPSPGRATISASREPGRPAPWPSLRKASRCASSSASC